MELAFACLRLPLLWSKWMFCCGENTANFSLIFAVLPPSLPPPPKKRRTSKSKYSVQEEDHLTGCARSEGYYKIDMREKVKYLPHHRLKNTSATSTPGELKKTVSHPVMANLSGSLVLVGVAQVKSSGRVNRANQRKLASLYSAGDVSSDIAKYNQFKVQSTSLWVHIVSMILFRLGRNCSSFQSPPSTTGVCLPWSPSQQMKW